MNLSAALQADVFNKTTIKVILFDGTKKQWLIWMEKFMARAARKGYKSLLEDGTYKGLEIPQDDVTSDVSAEALSEEYFDAGEGVESSEDTKKDGEPKMKTDSVSSSYDL